MPSSVAEHGGTILSELGSSSSLRQPMLLILFCIYIFLYSLYFLSVPSLIFLLFLPVGRDAPGSSTVPSTA